MFFLPHLPPLVLTEGLTLCTENFSYLCRLKVGLIKKRMKISILMMRR